MRRYLLEFSFLSELTYGMIDTVYRKAAAAIGNEKCGIEIVRVKSTPFCQPVLDGFTTMRIERDFSIGAAFSISDFEKSFAFADQDIVDGKSGALTYAHSRVEKQNGNCAIAGRWTALNCADEVFLLLLG